MEKNEEPQLKFEKDKIEISPAQKLKEEVDKKFKNIDALIYAVVVSLVITAISALISVGAIIIDQLHFNNQTYRDFSSLDKENPELIKRIDRIESRIDNLQSCHSPRLDCDGADE